MKNEATTLDQVNEGLKTLSKRHNVSLEALSKVYFFIKDVKKEVEKSPMVSLSAMVAKHEISNTYVSVLYDKVVSNIKGMPRTHKEWTGPEVSPRLAFDVMQYKKQVAKGHYERGRKKDNSQEIVETAKQVGNLAGIDSGRFDFETKSYINAAIEDHPDEEFMKHKILGFFRMIKDMVDSDAESRLGQVAKKFALPTFYLTHLKSFGFLENRGMQIAPRYFWTGNKPTMKDAIKGYDIYNKEQAKKRDERREKMEQEQQKLAQMLKDEQAEKNLQNAVSETLAQNDDKVNGKHLEEVAESATVAENVGGKMAEAIEKADEVIQEVKKEEAEKTATVAVTAEPIPKKGGMWDLEDMDPTFLFKVKPQHTVETKKFKLFGLPLWSVTKIKQIK